MKQNLYAAPKHPRVGRSLFRHPLSVWENEFFEEERLRTDMPR